MVAVLRPAETERVKERIDGIGLSLLILWVGALQLMLDLGREHDWFGSQMIVTLAVVAAIGFLMFLIWELTEDKPAVDLRPFRHRGFSVAVTAPGWATGASAAMVRSTASLLRRKTSAPLLAYVSAIASLIFSTARSAGSTPEMAKKHVCMIVLMRPFKPASRATRYASMT